MESMLGAQAMPDAPRLDHKRYVRHVLTNGTKEEKRELLLCVKSELVLRDRHVTTPRITAEKV